MPSYRCTECGGRDVAPEPLFTILDTRYVKGACASCRRSVILVREDLYEAVVARGLRPRRRRRMEVVGGPLR